MCKAFIGDEPFAVLLGDDIVYNPENPCPKTVNGVLMNILVLS